MLSVCAKKGAMVMEAMATIKPNIFPRTHDLLFTRLLVEYAFVEAETEECARTVER